MHPRTYWYRSFPASSFLTFVARSFGRLISNGEIEVVATVGAVRLDNGVCTSFGVITSVGKLLSAGVGSSVGNALATGLEESSDVDATVNMLHRHVSINDSLPLYSYNLSSMFAKEVVIAFMKGATSVVLLESKTYKECKKIIEISMSLHSCFGMSRKGAPPFGGSVA